MFLDMETKRAQENCSIARKCTGDQWF